MTSLLENDSEKQTEYKKYEISSWDDENLSLDTKLLRGIYAFGFEKPSPIQNKGLIPLIQPGCKGKRRDIIAQAQSGTGKTATFSIALLNKINSSDSLKALILIPTRELAVQIYNVISSIGVHCNISIFSC